MHDLNVRHMSRDFLATGGPTSGASPGSHPLKFQLVRKSPARPEPFGRIGRETGLLGRITAWALQPSLGCPVQGNPKHSSPRVGMALQNGRIALTFMCGDSTLLRARPSIAEHRRLSCRSGLSTPLDHFVSTEQSIELLSQAPSGALLAFDEAQHFGEQVVDSWCAAAERGVEILIASPSCCPTQGIESPRARSHALAIDVSSVSRA